MCLRWGGRCLRGPCMSAECHTTGCQPGRGLWRSVGNIRPLPLPCTRTSTWGKLEASSRPPLPAETQAVMKKSTRIAIACVNFLFFSFFSVCLCVRQRERERREGWICSLSAFNAVATITIQCRPPELAVQVFPTRTDILWSTEMNPLNLTSALTHTSEGSRTSRRESSNIYTE